MAKKTNKSKTETVVETTATAPETVKPVVETTEEKPELVMETNFVPEEPEKEEKANEAEEPEKEETPAPEKEPEQYVESTVVLTNCTQNTICITTGTPGISITVAPREIKRVSRSDLRELMKQEMVRRYFDKGLLSSNLEADEQSTSEAVVPDDLKGPVERHEDGSTVTATVKKFEKQGTVSIDL